MLKKLVLTLLSVFFLSNASAETIDKTQPYHMMKQVAQITFARLKAEQTNIQKDPNYLKQIVSEELMPYVNDKYAALKLLGPNLKGAKREDVRTFIKAFHGYLISSYAQVLTQYTDQTIQFGPKPQLNSKKNITTIKVDIIDSPRPNIKLEFKLRRDKKSGEWQAFDMVAEGISLLSSKQSEWSDKLRQEGILSVAKDLDDIAKKPIHIERKS